LLASRLIIISSLACPGKIQKKVVLRARLILAIRARTNHLLPQKHRKEKTSAKLAFVSKEGSLRTGFP
jgi:hypothetical protein